jgi:hypothetical protein
MGDLKLHYKKMYSNEYMGGGGIYTKKPPTDWGSLSEVQDVINKICSKVYV